MVVDLPDESYGLVELLLPDVAGPREDYRSGIFDLVLVELLEVLKIDLALGCVDDSYRSADLSTFNALNGSYYIRELAYSGGLDEDTVGSELVDDFLKGCAEIAYQRAADAAGVHLGDLYAGLLQKAAVDTDLAEFVLDKDELLAVITVAYELLDESRLSGSQETRENVYFCCHFFLPSFKYIQLK